MGKLVEGALVLLQAVLLTLVGYYIVIVVAFLTR